MMLSTYQMTMCGESPFLVQSRGVKRKRAATSYLTRYLMGSHHLVRSSRATCLLWNWTVERRKVNCFVAPVVRTGKSFKSNQ